MKNKKNNKVNKNVIDDNSSKEKKEELKVEEKKKTADIEEKEVSSVEDEKETSASEEINEKSNNNESLNDNDKSKKKEKELPKKKKIKSKIKRFKKRHIVILLIILFIIYRIISAGKNMVPDIEQISKVEKRDIVSSISATGNVKSVDTKDVSESTMTGMSVETINVKEGDVINTGDVICTFNTDTLKSTLNQLKSSTSGLSGLSGLSSANPASGLQEGVSSVAKQSVEEAKKAYEQSNSSLEATNAQLSQAQVELDKYKPTYDAALKIFQPKKDGLAQKEEEYNQAVEDHRLVEIDYTIAETEYYKYYHHTTPPTLRDEYANTDGTIKSQYANEIQKAKEDFQKAETKKANAIIKENTKLKDLENFRKLQYAPAEAIFTPIEQKYNQLRGSVEALQAQKAALEASTQSLKSTYLNLSTIASAASSSSMFSNDLSSSLSGLNSDMSSLNSQIAQMQKQIDNAVVKSPVSGTVTAIGVHAGDVYTGSPIVRIENCQSFEIEAFIDEYDIADVQKGMDVKIKTNATRDEVLNGKVTYVAISSASLSSGMDLSALAGGMSSYTGVAASTGGTATYKIKIDINTPNDRLRAGMNARLSIITNKADNVLSVPYESVFERDDGTNYIKVVKPDYDIDANIAKTDEKYQKITGKAINIEGSSTKKVLSDSIEDYIEEIDVEAGIEGTYYIEISSDKISEGMYVIVPKADSDNSLTQLFEMMGADAGI